MKREEIIKSPQVDRFFLFFLRENLSLFFLEKPF
jgi:hypothetical protein